jgi:hypothetical protein
VFDCVAVSVTISPGPGTEGSLCCKFISTVDRRRPVLDPDRFARVKELLDEPILPVRLANRLEHESALELEYKLTWRYLAV